MTIGQRQKWLEVCIILRITHAAANGQTAAAAAMVMLMEEWAVSRALTQHHQQAQLRRLAHRRPHLIRAQRAATITYSDWPRKRPATAAGPIDRSTARAGAGKSVASVAAD
uniref:Secreted protein n=1 Tax=Plectus sambesii TaxID=2011161 RepID=A0A914XEI3_9BILA